MPLKGSMNIHVQYGDQTKHLDLIVVTEDGPTLLERSWLQHICMDWATIRRVSANKQPLDQELLLARHASVFKDELGTIYLYNAKLHIRPDAVLKFCKPRSVPYATKLAIETELKRLEASSILKKVS